MTDLERTAHAFVEMAHRIVWCTAASVDRRGRPRARILHPIWEWRDGALKGWIATSPTPTKRSHLAASPNLSLTYWEPGQDTCTAECRARFRFDDDTRVAVWNRFARAPAPVGYDPAIIPGWTSPTCDDFAAIELDPWLLRVFPGTLLLEGRGEVHTWSDPAA